jgi:hypothetical protein
LERPDVRKAKPTRSLTTKTPQSKADKDALLRFHRATTKIGFLQNQLKAAVQEYQSAVTEAARRNLINVRNPDAETAPLPEQPVETAEESAATDQTQ